MSERENSSIAVRAASGSARRVVPNMLRRWILALAALAALVFVPAGPSQAQSQSAASKSAPASVVPSASIQGAATNAATLAQGATPQPVAESSEPVGQSAPKGRREGIAVHGHWTIEIRNTDGTLASRQAFDNELLDIGASLLANLLSGTYAPAGWELHVAGTNATQVPTSQPNPCGTGAYNLSGTTVTFAPNPGFIACNLLEAGTSSGATFCSTGAPNDFCTLTRTPAIGTTVGAAAGKVAITLSGTFPAPNAGWVGAVASDMLICNTTYSPSTNGLVTISASACMTGLPAGATGQTNYFTATLLPSPMQVTTAGQTVAVTVTLSFQ